MNKRILSIIVIVAGLFISCGQDETGEKTTGTLEVVLETPLPEMIITRSAEVDINDLLVEIKNQTTTSVVFMDTYEELKKEGLLELPAGSYIITVSSPENLNDHSSTPYYKGESNFEITPGYVRVVTVECELQYIKIAVDLTALLDDLDISGVEMWNGDTEDTHLYDFASSEAGIYNAHYFLPDNNLQLVIKGKTKVENYPLGSLGIKKLVEDVPELKGEVKANVSLLIKAKLATGDALQASVNDLIFNAQLITAE